MHDPIELWPQCCILLEQYVYLAMPPWSTYAPPPEHETDCHHSIGEHVHKIYTAHHNDDIAYRSRVHKKEAEEPMYTAVSIKHKLSVFACSSPCVVLSWRSRSTTPTCTFRRRGWCDTQPCSRPGRHDRSTRRTARLCCPDRARRDCLHQVLCHDDVCREM